MAVHHRHGFANQSSPKNCPFYGSERGCIKGINCPFSHDRPLKAVQICPFWKSKDKSCGYGYNCKFRHYFQLETSFHLGNIDSYDQNSKTSKKKKNKRSTRGSNHNRPTEPDFDASRGNAIAIENNTTIDTVDTTNTKNTNSNKNKNKIEQAIKVKRAIQVKLTRNNETIPAIPKNIEREDVLKYQTMLEQGHPDYNVNNNFNSWKTTRKVLFELEYRMRPKNNDDELMTCTMNGYLKQNRHDSNVKLIATNISDISYEKIDQTWNDKKQYIKVKCFWKIQIKKAFEKALDSYHLFNKNASPVSSDVLNIILKFVGFPFQITTVFDDCNNNNDNQMFNYNDYNEYDNYNHHHDGFGDSWGGESGAGDGVDSWGGNGYDANLDNNFESESNSGLTLLVLLNDIDFDLGKVDQNQILTKRSTMLKKAIESNWTMFDVFDNALTLLAT